MSEHLQQQRGVARLRERRGGAPLAVDAREQLEQLQRAQRRARAQRGARGALQVELLEQRVVPGELAQVAAHAGGQLAVAQVRGVRMQLQQHGQRALGHLQLRRGGRGLGRAGRVEGELQPVREAGGEGGVGVGLEQLEQRGEQAEPREAGQARREQPAGC